MNRDAVREVVFEELARLAPEADLQALPPGARLREELDIDSFDFNSAPGGTRAAARRAHPGDGRGPARDPGRPAGLSLRPAAGERAGRGAPGALSPTSSHPVTSAEIARVRSSWRAARALAPRARRGMHLEIAILR